jgi:hypothetical protein
MELNIDFSRHDFIIFHDYVFARRAADEWQIVQIPIIKQSFHYNAMVP